MMHTFKLENGVAYCIQPLTKEEIDEARILCDECVGKNLYSADEIAAALNAQDRFFYLLKSEKGETVGYIYAYSTDLEYIADYSKLDIGLFRAVYSEPNKKVGIIQSVGLKAEYRGIGLGTQMMRFILEKLKELCEIAFIICWKPGKAFPLAKAIRECRFSFLSEAKMIWYDDTDLICPYCNGRCLCDAEVYYKML